MWNWGAVGRFPGLRTSLSPRRSCQGPSQAVKTPNHFLIPNLGSQRILVTGITEWQQVGGDLGVCSSGWEGGMCFGEETALRDEEVMGREVI